MEPADDRPAVRERGPRGPYREKLCVYADRYGCKERSIKRWVALGRTEKDPCPLDDPEALLAWWSRTSPNRCPDGINAAVIQWRKRQADSAPAPSPSAEPTEKVDPPAPSAPAAPSDNPFADVDETKLGLEHELYQLERLAQVLGKKAHEPGQAKNYLDTVARMTATSSKLREEMEKHRLLIPRVEAQQAIFEFHGPIAQGVRDLYAKFCEATGLPASPERQEWWNRACDALFARFKEEVFQ